jgi:hypothetical protein
MVFYSVYVIPGYAQNWALDETSYEDLAVSDNVLTASDSDAGIALLSFYSQPYDGSISTTYTTYFRGVVEKLPPASHYVLFRSDQYNYRLIYSDSMTYENGRFAADSAQYVNYYVGNYNNRSQVTSGVEGAFSLSPNGYPVYSDLSELYPVLSEGVKNYEFKALLFCFAFFILFTIAKSFFSSGHYKI